MFNKICYLLVTLVFFSCSSETEMPLDYGLENPVFPKAKYLIETYLPAFDDTTSITPTFTWIITSQTYVFLGVFNDNIIVRENIIVNIENNIWTWHSGLGEGREGNVEFTDGCDVINGILMPDSPPTPLNHGQSYIWAIWAWDDEGINITHSSQEMFFTVIEQ